MLSLPWHVSSLPKKTNLYAKQLFPHSRYYINWNLAVFIAFKHRIVFYYTEVSEEEHVLKYHLQKFIKQHTGYLFLLGVHLHEYKLKIILFINHEKNFLFIYVSFRINRI